MAQFANKSANLKGDLPTASRRISSTPIQVHVTETLFDAPSSEERLDKKPPIVQFARKFATSSFGFWMRLSGKIARRFGWFPSVEPYIGYGTDRYARLICRTVLAPKAGHCSALKRGIYAMLVVPAIRVKVALSIDDVAVEWAQVGDSSVYDKPDATFNSSAEYCVSDCSGYLDLVTERSLLPGEHKVSYKVDNREPVNASLFVISEDTPFGVISDVDDTIMVTQAPSPLKAAYNLLIMNPEHRHAVNSMSHFFNRIRDFVPSAPFFYLSTSPWNVEASIRHFILREGFPSGPLLLRDLDPRPKTFVPTGPQHKLEFAQQLMDDFPGMKFILIGDDGQKDPSTYAKIIEKFPDRVLAVGIRQLKKDATLVDFRRNMSKNFGVTLASSRVAKICDSEFVDAIGAAGTFEGVPFFAAPNGAILEDLMIPFIMDSVNRKA